MNPGNQSLDSVVLLVMEMSGALDLPIEIVGDEPLSFDEAATRESQRLYAIALAILRDPTEAEDAVQETLLRAWRRWNSLRDPSRRRPWLTRICVNLSINHKKGLVRRLFISDGPELPYEQDEGVDPDRDRAMQHLSREQRALVILHFSFGYTLDECAEMAGCKPGTARSRLSRALETLRREYGQ